MKNEKFCFNKSVGLVAIVLFVVGLVTFLLAQLPQRKTTTSTRAYEQEGQLVLPKAYFTITEVGGTIKYDQLKDTEDGKNDGDVRFMKSQSDYRVCINDTGLDTSIRNPEDKNNFSFKFTYKDGRVVNPTDLIVEIEENIFACRKLRFNKSAFYTISGAFTPKIEGYRKRITVSLPITINTPDTDLQAHFVVFGECGEGEGDEITLCNKLYDGMSNKEVQYDGNTIYLRQGHDYAFTLENNSVDKVVWDVLSDKYRHYSYWTLKAPGAQVSMVDNPGPVLGVEKNRIGYWKVNYKERGLYVLEGSFKPKINEYRKKLPAKLNVRVMREDMTY